MTATDDKRPVVYYYADPAFPWDLGQVVADVETRGFRVVKGGAADELLFLLQMGRPAAILFTLSTPEARTHASYQMIARRAADMLVPMIVAGPDDPRDGVLLRYPRGGAFDESHAPLRAIGDLLARFDAEPPSTPSRPPMVVANQTFGKGRTVMTWRRDAQPLAETLPPGPPAAPPEEPRSERKTMPARKKSAAPADPAALRDAVTSEAATLSPSDGIRAPEEPPARTPRRADEPFEAPDVIAAGHVPRDEVAPIAVAEADRPLAPRRARAWKVPVAIAGGVAVGAAALVIYLVTAPSPRAAEDATRGAIPAAKAGAGAVDAQPAGGGLVAESQPGADPGTSADGADAAADEPSTGERRTRRVRAEVPPAAAEELLADASGAVRFPGHFRDGLALFWFAGDWEERRFLDLVRSLGPTARIRLVGHATKEELSATAHNLALGRAFAVEKYLVRQGIAEDRIDTEAGAPVQAASDVDDRGWPRNRWVDVRFD